jgi:O-succinylbenzoic acid--CoA ligase
VRAVVVAAEGRSAPGLDELREWVGSTLPRSAAPRELLVVDDLPRTALGKLRRSSLVDAGGGRGSGGASGGR